MGITREVRQGEGPDEFGKPRGVHEMAFIEVKPKKRGRK